MEDLRRSLRATLSVDGVPEPFDPAPYVLNGPEDQLPFFEKLLELQEEPLSKGLISPDRLTLVARIPSLGVVPSQSLLESPKASATAWRGTYGSHGWHRYVGRFPPHLVRALLNHFALQPGGTVCDPFLGSGTTLVEARLLGLKGLGVEVCPLSTMISKAKSTFPRDSAALQTLPAKLTAFYQERWKTFTDVRQQPSHNDVLSRPGNSIQRFANIERWFTPEALLGTSIVVEFIEGLEGYERDLVATCLSAQMRSIGNVDVDVVRAEYRKTPRENVDVLKLVLRKLTSALKSMHDSSRTHSATLGNTEDIAIHETSLLRADIEPGTVDAIITSPPYGVESLSYLRTHLLSYRSLEPILGHDVYAWNRDIIGSEYLGADVPVVNHRAAQHSPSYRTFFEATQEHQSVNEAKRSSMMMQFFDDMTETSQRMSEWLKPGGRLAFVVGNKRLADRVIPTDRIMMELFESVGLRVDEVITHKLKTNNSNSEVPWQERVIQEENVIICTRVGHAAA